MGAPDTNLERQKRRHRWPLIGIGVAVAFGVGMMLFWLFGTVSDATPPEGAETQIDGTTGDPTD
jgi:hypothetical protein